MDIGKTDQWNGCQEFGEYLECKNIWWWWFPSCIYVLTLSYCTFKIDNHHPPTHTHTNTHCEFKDEIINLS